MLYRWDGSIVMNQLVTLIHCCESGWPVVSRLVHLFGTFHRSPRHLNQLLWLLWICISLWSGSFFHTLGIPYPWRDQILNFPDLFGQHLWNSEHSLSTEIHGLQEIRCGEPTTTTTVRAMNKTKPCSKVTQPLRPWLIQTEGTFQFHRTWRSFLLTV